MKAALHLIRNARADDLNRFAWQFVQGFAFVVFAPMLAAIVAILVAT